MPASSSWAATIGTQSGNRSSGEVTVAEEESAGSARVGTYQTSLGWAPRRPSPSAALPSSASVVLASTAPSPSTVVAGRPRSARRTASTPPSLGRPASSTTSGR
jgi:hypothetical protein